MFELVVLASYIAALLTVSVITISLASELLVSKGPQGIVIAEIITLSLGTLLSVPFTFFVLKDAPTWEFAVVGFLCSLGVVYFTSRRRNEDANNAPVIIEFALANFDRIDTNRDGSINRLDIWDAIESGKFSQDEIKKLNLLLWRVEAIGHVYDWISVASYPPPSFPIALYAINRQDLASYEKRTLRYSGGMFA